VGGRLAAGGGGCQRSGWAEQGRAECDCGAVQGFERGLRRGDLSVAACLKCCRCGARRLATGSHRSAVVSEAIDINDLAWLTVPSLEHTRPATRRSEPVPGGPVQ
jgi:hypothetical protein